jgi:hypothetical protein
MTDPTKRTLSELITLHEIEPTLTEVITEGRIDAALILWFLRRCGSDAAVYCIVDRLTVPWTEVKRRGQPSGAKGSVITAALEVQEESPEAAENITFIYDPDDDLIAKREVPEAACLVKTDYASMELYCFAEGPIDKLLKVTLRAREDVEASAVLRIISGPLVELACTRLVLRSIDDSVAIVSNIERRLRVAGNELMIDVHNLIVDSIGRAGGPQKLGVDIATLERQEHELAAAFPADIRMGIRGHDFTRTCCYYLKTRFPNLFKDDRAPYKTPAVFENVLITCLDISELAGNDLFKKLLTRHDGTIPS